MMMMMISGQWRRQNVDECQGHFSCSFFCQWFVEDDNYSFTEFNINLTFVNWNFFITHTFTHTIPLFCRSLSSIFFLFAFVCSKEKSWPNTSILIYYTTNMMTKIYNLHVCIELNHHLFRVYPQVRNFDAAKYWIW